MQTRRQRVIESLTDSTVGFIIALVAQLIVYPVYGIDVAIIDNIQLAVIFVSISFIKKYIVRTCFNRRQER